MQAKEPMNLIDFTLKSHMIKALLPFQLLLAIACLIKETRLRGTYFWSRHLNPLSRLLSRPTYLWPKRDNCKSCFSDCLDIKCKLITLKK